MSSKSIRFGEIKKNTDGNLELDGVKLTDGEEIELKIGGRLIKATVSKNGEWKLVLNREPGRSKSMSPVGVLARRV